MSDRTLRFRVGLFVITALIATGWLVFQFGKLERYLEPKYAIAIHVANAGGVHPGTAVEQFGIVVGRVREIRFDEKRGGVLLVVDVDGEHRFRQGTRARLVKSLLGGTDIELIPGDGEGYLKPNTLLVGEPASDPMDVVRRMEKRLDATLESFAATSREWQGVGKNVNEVLGSNRQKLDTVVEQTLVALRDFSTTMRTANEAVANADSLLGDPENQENVRKMLAALPQLAEETRDAVTAMKTAVASVEANLDNLNAATEPLAKHSEGIVTKLDGTLGNLQSVSKRLDEFTLALEEEDGTVQRLVGDPALYRQMNNSAASLAALLRNLEPIARDLRIFSDKIARHPELMGVGGALRGSNGLKDAEEAESASPIQRTGGVQSGRAVR